MSEAWISGVGRTGRRGSGRRAGQRRGSAAWGLGRLGPVSLRPTEAWVEDGESD